jgi:predicted Zn finger-like uncharacterized protein
VKLARCPHCATIFRATPEQLEQRAGKVRCGKCRRVFNALEHLIEEPGAANGDSIAMPGPEEIPAPLAPAALPAESGEEAPREALTEAEAELPPQAQTNSAESGQEFPPDAEHPTEATGEAKREREVKPPKRRAKPEPSPAAAEPEPVAPEESTRLGPPSAFPSDRSTNPPDAMQEAQAAGIAAQRETRGLPGFKWAEGALSAPDTHFTEPKGAPWLMTVVAIVLALMLIAQLVNQFRTEIAARWPDFRPWLEEACVSLNCTVPYPRKADLISLEASELSIDAARGNMLVLHFTLKNRAAFAQDYPAVELTLTDVQDNIVVRRTLPPGEYLPPALEGSKAFAAGAEVAARLWIDARDTGAVGYRLYVFYP